VVGVNAKKTEPRQAGIPPKNGVNNDRRTASRGFGALWFFWLGLVAALRELFDPMKEKHRGRERETETQKQSDGAGPPFFFVRMSGTTVSPPAADGSWICQAARFASNPFEFLHEQHEKHGDCFTFHLDGCTDPVTAIRGPEAARRLFDARERWVHRFPGPRPAADLVAGNQPVLLFLRGEAHLARKRWWMDLLYGPAAAGDTGGPSKGLLPDLVARAAPIVRRRLRQCFASRTGACDVAAATDELTRDLISECLVGLPRSAPAMQRMLEQNDLVSRSLFSVPLDTLPYTGVALTPYSLAKQARIDINSALERLVAETRQKAGGQGQTAAAAAPSMRAGAARAPGGPPDEVLAADLGFAILGALGLSADFSACLFRLADRASGAQRAPGPGGRKLRRLLRRDPAALRSFCLEIRRTFGALAQTNLGLVHKSFAVGDRTVRKGSRVLLSLYETNMTTLPDAAAFCPLRFPRATASGPEPGQDGLYCPMGAGDARSTHRCLGEILRQELLELFVRSVTELRLRYVVAGSEPPVLQDPLVVGHGPAPPLCLRVTGTATPVPAA